MQETGDLTRIAEVLAGLRKHSQSAEIQEAIESLWSAAYSVNRSWSGSCIGYHANVYYRDFEPPPPEQNFSVEWGITGGMFGSQGEWMERDPEDVQQVIYERAGVSDDAVLVDFNDRVGERFEEQRFMVLSVLSALSKRLGPDDFLSLTRAKTDRMTLSTFSDLVSSLMPKGQLSTRDQRAVMEGSCIPRHYHVLARVMQTKKIIEAIGQLQTLVNTIRQHVVRAEPPESPGANGAREAESERDRAVRERDEGESTSDQVRRDHDKTVTRTTDEGKGLRKQVLGLRMTVTASIATLLVVAVRWLWEPALVGSPTRWRIVLVLCAGAIQALATSVVWGRKGLGVIVAVTALLLALIQFLIGVA